MLSGETGEEDNAPLTAAQQARVSETLPCK
jgi:hypothetical protein